MSVALLPGQMSLPALDALPALSDEDLALIAEQTRETLTDLLSHDALSANTSRTYASALRYWDAWHRASFGTQLPLLRTPRNAVSAETVLAFLAHHTPDEVKDGVSLAMPAPVRERMRLINAFGTRLATRRSGAISEEVPTLATIRQRIASLSSCHRIAGIAPEWADNPHVARTLRALANRASKIAPGMLRKPKKPATRDVLDSMLRACLPDGIKGVRDAALLQVAFFTGGRRRSELTQMRWCDLAPLALAEPIEGIADGYLWSLNEVKGKRRERADMASMEIPILGRAANALDRWRDICFAHGHCETDKVWWRVIPSSRKEDRLVISTPMIAADVWHIMRERVAQIGLNPSDFGAHSLRSGAATSNLLEGMALADASRLLGHTKVETTRQYYDQRGAPIEALAKMVARR